MGPLREAVYAALDRERRRLGAYHKVLAHYEHLVAFAVLNDDALKRVHEHIKVTGGMAGL